MIAVARLLIRFAAAFAPGHLRARWREEWLAEIDAVVASRGRARAFRLALGAPIDAVLTRWTTTAGLGGAWRSDLTHTLRVVTRSPWHVLTVSLCLGIGIAVCTATFSILNGIINGDLPGVEGRDRIARMYITVDGDFFNPTLDDFDILADGSPSFLSVAAERRADFAVRVPGHEPISVAGAFVSGTYFPTLGTTAFRGRLLHTADDRRDAPLAVVLSHALWKGRLGAPDDIVGRTIAVGGTDAFVAGIAPESFSGLDIGDLGEPPGLRFKIYLPLSHARTRENPGRGEYRFTVFGRVRDEIDVAALGAELQPLAARIEAADRVRKGKTRIVVSPAGLTPGAGASELFAIVLLMMAAPLTVLAIGCANVANLQLVRASLRGRELAVRASLGASRGQIVRLLTLEATLLAVTAFATAAVAINILLRIAALVIPVRIALDVRVLAFSLAVAAGIIVATGLLPALAATRGRYADALRAGGRSMTAGNSRARRALVVAQVALCFMLLLAAAVFTRGIGVIAGEMPPHAPGIVIAQLRFDLKGYPQAARQAYLDRLVARMSADGRVQSAGATSVAPLGGQETRFWITGSGKETERYTFSAYVSPTYFDASAMPLLRGRTFGPSDTSAVIVDERFIERHGLTEPVLGQTLKVEFSETDAPRMATIIGVAAPAPRQVMVRTSRPTMYMPLTPVPDYVAVWMRTTSPREIADDARRAIAAIDPDLPPLAVRTLEEHYAEDAAPLTLIAKTAGGLGSVSLLLAIAGVYSVIAFFVALRTNEFGVRMALGARSADITQLVIRQAGRLVGFGLAAGALFGAPLLVGLHSAFPFTQPFDPLVVIPTAVVLMGTAMAASWLPARRAARVDPLLALRAE